MNIAEARKLAKQKYGPGANAVNVSSKDRHQRFGIMLYVPGGAFDSPKLGCLGHGDSYQAAWDMAEQNQVAQQIALQWIQTKADYVEFGKDPMAYKEKRVQEILSTVKDDQQNG